MWRFAFCMFSITRNPQFAKDLQSANPPKVSVKKIIGAVSGSGSVEF